MVKKIFYRYENNVDYDSFICKDLDNLKEQFTENKIDINLIVKFYFDDVYFFIDASGYKRISISSMYGFSLDSWIKIFQISDFDILKKDGWSDERIKEYSNYIKAIEKALL